MLLWSREAPLGTHRNGGSGHQRTYESVGPLAGFFIEDAEERPPQNTNTAVLAKVFSYSMYRTLYLFKFICATDTELYWSWEKATLDKFSTFTMIDTVPAVLFAPVLVFQSVFLNMYVLSVHQKKRIKWIIGQFDFVLPRFKRGCFVIAHKLVWCLSMHTKLHCHSYTVTHPPQHLPVFHLLSAPLRKRPHRAR